MLLRVSLVWAVLAAVTTAGCRGHAPDGCHCLSQRETVAGLGALYGIDWTQIERGRVGQLWPQLSVFSPLDQADTPPVAIETVTAKIVTGSEWCGLHGGGLLADDPASLALVEMWAGPTTRPQLERWPIDDDRAADVSWVDVDEGPDGTKRLWIDYQSRCLLRDARCLSDELDALAPHQEASGARGCQGGDDRIDRVLREESQPDLHSPHRRCLDWRPILDATT